MNIIQHHKYAFYSIFEFPELTTLTLEILTMSQWAPLVCTDISPYRSQSTWMKDLCETFLGISWLLLDCE